MTTHVHQPPLSILVVDDYREAAESLAELLRLSTYRVAISNTGGEALRSCAADPPDVVLLDIRLPDVDGWEVARRLRAWAVEKRPLIIAITGYGTDADRSRSVEAGVDLHIIKPAEPGVLLGVLDRFARVLSLGIPQPDVICNALA